MFKCQHRLQEEHNAGHAEDTAPHSSPLHLHCPAARAKRRENPAPLHPHPSNLSAALTSEGIVNDAEEELHDQVAADQRERHKVQGRKPIGAAELLLPVCARSVRPRHHCVHHVRPALRARGTGQRAGREHRRVAWRLPYVGTCLQACAKGKQSSSRRKQRALASMVMHSKTVSSDQKKVSNVLMPTYLPSGEVVRMHSPCPEGQVILGPSLRKRDGSVHG